MLCFKILNKGFVNSVPAVARKTSKICFVTESTGNEKLEKLD